MNKRQNVWNRLQEEMKAKRKRPDPRGKGKSKKSGTAPHELIVQRLASEPDNKQTFRPVHPREFVPFTYEEQPIYVVPEVFSAWLDIQGTALDLPFPLVQLS